MSSPAPNRFDALNVDVQEIYRQFPYTAKDIRPNFPRFYERLYRNRLLPLRYRVRLLTLLRQTRVDLSWFEDFHTYWKNVLGGRPLWTVDDFHFLRGIYRMRFAGHQVADGASADQHLQAWQDPLLLYQLMHTVMKEASEEGIAGQFYALSQLKKLERPPERILEFGCSTASLSAFLLDFVVPGAEVVISDIQTLAFHYATYRFRHTEQVTPLLLQPEHDFLLHLTKPVDAIFCLAVFEHLNQPLETVRRFYDSLNPGGLLIFDYLLSEGTGLDTRQAVIERPAVLDFIEQHFEVSPSPLPHDKSLGIVAARKR